MVLTLSSPATDVEARLQQARMLALPQLLFRQTLKQPLKRPAANQDDPSGDEDSDLSLALVIKDRLIRAYRGEWRAS